MKYLLLITSVFLLILLCFVFKLILSDEKQSMTEDDFDVLSDSFIDFNTEFIPLDGAHRYPITIHNMYGTCFIDALLNSIANSEALVKQFKSVLPDSKVSDDQILYAFNDGMKTKRIVSSLINKKYTTDNTLRTLYDVLICAFIRGIDTYNDATMVYISLYMMYLANMFKFGKMYPSKTKSISVNDSLYDLVCKTDYNFIAYFNYCQKLMDLGKDNDMAGVGDENLTKCILSSNYATCQCNKSKIQKELNSHDESDIFISVLYNIVDDRKRLDDMFDACIKRYNSKYLCTDIVFDLYKQDEYYPYHSVFFNVNQGKLHDDGKITEASINVLAKVNNDGEYYVPSILHFQLK